MKRRRDLMKFFGASALALPLCAFAQQRAKIPRIGFLISETLAGQANRIEALRAGLRELGYIENKNLVIELRTADSTYERLPALAASLVQIKVDVLVAFGAKAVVAAQQATSTIPIVVPSTGDPITLGLTKSLARPSGNITGSTPLGPTVSAKRVELLKETAPRVVRVAALQNPVNTTGVPTLQLMHATAKALKVELHQFDALSRAEIASSFLAMAKKHIDGVVVQQDTLFIANAREIAELASKHHIVCAGTTEFAEAGGLIGYGAKDAELYRRGAYFIDRILKGAKPGQLPFEQATKFELVINLKTAKAFGISVPQSVMLRADKVIE
jgi:putative tryptophan/tyrosine transport system substrate-binding protein